MTEPTDRDSILGFLRKLANLDNISDEARAAAEECRQILLALERERVPKERYNAIEERFIENWDVFEDELTQQTDVICTLVTFAVDVGNVELHVRLEGTI